MRGERKLSPRTNLTPKILSIRHALIVECERGRVQRMQRRSYSEVLGWIVWIALRYHDGVTRVRYLLTNALSACGYGQRRRGAPAADASAGALIAVARHARVLLQCMSLLLAQGGPSQCTAMSAAGGS